MKDCETCGFNRSGKHPCDPCYGCGGTGENHWTPRDKPVALNDDYYRTEHTCETCGYEGSYGGICYWCRHFGKYNVNKACKWKPKEQS